MEYCQQRNNKFNHLVLTIWIRNGEKVGEFFSQTYHGLTSLRAVHHHPLDILDLCRRLEHVLEVLAAGVILRGDDDADSLRPVPCSSTNLGEKGEKMVRK